MRLKKEIKVFTKFVICIPFDIFMHVHDIKMQKKDFSSGNFKLKLNPGLVRDRHTY